MFWAAVTSPVIIWTFASRRTPDLENGVARSERLQHHIADVESGALHALVDVLGRSHEPRNNMDVRLEADARHADRVAHTVLSVDDELLRYHMDDSPVRRKRHALGVLDEAVHVGLRDFVLGPADRDHSPALKALDVVARDADDHRLDLDPRTRFRLGYRALDGADRLVDVCHDAARQSVGRAPPHAEDVEPASFIGRRNDAAHLGRPDIQPDYNLIVHSGSFLRSF